ncbi:MAG: hypothetical protein QM758_29405 [Armatimonas sp.]
MKKQLFALSILVLPLAAVLAQEPPPPVTDPPPVQTVEPPKTTPTPTPTPTPKPKNGGFSLKTNGGTLGAADGGNGEKILGPLGKGLTFSGGWSLTGRANSVSGTAQAKSWYDYQNNNSYLSSRPLGPLQQNLDLSVNGKLLGIFDVSANLTNDRFRATQQQVLGLNYDSKKGTRVSLGDVNAALPGNELVSFSRNLQGIYFSRDLSKNGMKITSVASITRALTRRGSFQGNGTTGPYFLNAQQITQGTETILLNGQKLVPGDDYKLDYFTGQFDLLKSRIINAQDTIEYTYEAQNINTRAGVLTGFRFDMPQVGGNTFGLTMLNQRSGAGGVRGAAGKVTQYFPVVGDINYRYFLDAPPQPNTTIEVKYQNRPLVEGADKDYIYNSSLNYIQLRVALPPDTSVTGISSLSVDYAPTQQNGTAGDKTVIGFDAGIKLPANGRLNLNIGRSGATSGGTSGTGMTMTSTFGAPEGAKRGWQFTTSFRDIQPGFSTIDSVSSAFLRAERTVSTNFTYNPNTFWKADIRLSQGRQGNSTLSTTTGGATTTPSSLTWAGDKSLSFGLEITPKSKGGTPLPEFTLRHDDRGQTYDGGSTTGTSRSTFKNDTLGFRWSPSKNGVFGIDGTIGRNESRGRSVFATGYTDTVGTGATAGNTVLDDYRNGLNGSSTNSASTTANVNLRYTPNSRLSLTGSVGTSKTSYLSSSTSTTTTGTTPTGNGTTQLDIGMGVRYQFSKALSLDWNASGGANGQSVAGYYSTNGNATGQKTRNQNLALHFAPTEKLDITLNHRRQLSLIPGYDNSENISTDLTATATITPTFLVNAQVMQQNNTYVSGSGKSDNLGYAITTQHGPFGKLSINTTLTRSAYGFGTSSLSTGGLGSGGIIGGGGGTGTISSATDGVMTTFGVQANYDLNIFSLFLRYANTNQLPGSSASTSAANDVLGGTGYHSSSNFRDSDLQIGAQWKLNALLGATLSARLANRKDRDDTRYSYRARTINLDMGLRF